MAVYFIQAGDGGPVKIGVAADPVHRMCELQVSHWVALRLLGVIPDAGFAEEGDLHGRYSAARIRGEWFWPVREIIEHAASFAISPRPARPAPTVAAFEIGLTEADLLRAVETHLAATGESEAAFGKRIARDPNLVGDLRRGRSPRMRLAQTIMQAMEAPPTPAEAAA